MEANIETVEAALCGGPAHLGITDSGVLLKKEDQAQRGKSRKEEAPGGQGPSS